MRPPRPLPDIWVTSTPVSSARRRAEGDSHCRASAPADGACADEGVTGCSFLFLGAGATAALVLGFCGAAAGSVTASSIRPTTGVTRVQRAPLEDQAHHLESAISALQAQNQDFLRIKVRVQGSLVYLTYGAGCASDAVFRMAQLVSELPGAERVIVKNENMR